MNPIKEMHKRTILKTITWRICAILGTMLIVFIFTKELILTLKIGIVDLIVKTTLYYIHERAWGKVSWGYAKYPPS